MTTTKDPSKKIVAEILTGRHDGHFDDFIKAMQERAADGAVAFRWRLRFGDHDWTEETVTLGEIEAAERLAGTTWINLNPRSSARHCLALIIARLHKIDGLDIAAAREKAETVSGAQLADVVSEYEVVSPPKDPGTSTTS